MKKTKKKVSKTTKKQTFKKYIARKGLKRLTSIQSNQYVVFRDRKGKIRNKSFSSNVKLIAEVRNRKTKKLIGYLNNIQKKTREIIPIKFTSKRQAYVQAKRTDTKAEDIVRKEYTFKVHSYERILDQIKDHVEPMMKDMKKTKLQHFRFAVETHHEYFIKLSDVISVPRKQMASIPQIIAYIILEMIMETSYRMSNLDLTSHKKRNMLRFLKVIVKWLR